MLCWGSWADTQKIDKRWRFELFYWDYIWSLLACALLFGLTLGNTNPASPDSFLRNLATASFRSLLEAFFGGVIFNLGNLLLVAAISVAGMAVAFPIGAGLALVLRSRGLGQCKETSDSNRHNSAAIRKWLPPETDA